MNKIAKVSPADRTKTRTASAVRLLVVEDDPDQRDLLTETLHDHFGPGCVTSVGSCEGARSVDLASFDLILCDYNLPDGNGLDLLLDLRRLSDTPVMMLTGENASEMAREAIQRGATDYVVKAGEYLLTIPLTVEKNITSARVQRERETAAASLRQRYSELEKNLRKVEQLASTDPMTGCYNRRAFDRIISQLFAGAYRTQADLACVMIDLDDFKKVNDDHGHAIGDQLIRLAARSILSNLRQMDAACRYGGDEFVVLLPKADAAQAALVADRIRRDYAEASSSIVGGSARTMSIGIATLRQGRPMAASAEALLETTDRALYQAKQDGRDRVHTA